MIDYLKSAAVVLVLAGAFFRLAKPVFLAFMSEEDFKLRSRCWLFINACAFVSPIFWIYAVCAGLILWRTARRDSNPVALYMFMLLAMAPVGLPLPTFGLVGALFPIDHLRLMSLVVLLPLILRAFNLNPRSLGTAARISQVPVLKFVDVMVIGYCLIQVLLMLPYSSITVSMRRIVLLAIDVLIPYFAISRALGSSPRVTEALAAFAMSVMVLAPMALLEMYSRTMLYSGFQEVWGTPQIYFQLLRDGLLRAQVTAGHSIVFGYVTAVALVVWLALMHLIPDRRWRWFGSLVLGASLAASFSRGPWVGAVAGAVTLLAIGPFGAKRIVKVCLLIVAAGGAVLVSPMGESVLAWVPFLGTQEAGTVLYRQRLLEISLALIAQNPLTGTPGFIQYMEELRQGQGIIDLVNGIITIALSYGLIGLAAYSIPKLTLLARCVALRKHPDESVKWSAAAVGSGMVVTIVVLFTAGEYLSIPYVFGAFVAIGALLLREVAAGVGAGSGALIGSDAMRAAAADGTSAGRVRARKGALGAGSF